MMARDSLEGDILRFSDEMRHEKVKYSGTLASATGRIPWLRSAWSLPDRFLIANGHNHPTKVEVQVREILVSTASLSLSCRRRLVVASQVVAGERATRSRSRRIEEERLLIPHAAAVCASSASRPISRPSIKALLYRPTSWGPSFGAS